MDASPYYYAYTRGLPSCAEHAEAASLVWRENAPPYAVTAPGTLRIPIPASQRRCSVGWFA